MNRIIAALALIALSLAVGVMAIGAVGIVQMLTQELKNWRRRNKQ